MTVEQSHTLLEPRVVQDQCSLYRSVHRLRTVDLAKSHKPQVSSGEEETAVEPEEENKRKYEVVDEHPIVVIEVVDLDVNMFDVEGRREGIDHPQNPVRHGKVQNDHLENLHFHIPPTSGVSRGHYNSPSYETERNLEKYGSEEAQLHDDVGWRSENIEGLGVWLVHELSNADY